MAGSTFGDAGVSLFVAGAIFVDAGLSLSVAGHESGMKVT